MEFNHEKLEVYQVSIQLLSLIFQTIRKIPPGYSFLSDQLKRASLSIPLNIAEGNAKFSLKERARFFKIARASANECAAIFDASDALQIIDKETCQKNKSLLYRIVCMLSKMCK
jgi:four helix bundle protein